MRGRGVLLLLAAAACAACGLDFEVGPVLGYGTPPERNALKSYEVNMGGTTVDAGKGFIYGARAAATSAPWTAELSASYMPTEKTLAREYETTRVEESAWRVSAAANYAVPALRMKAGLEFDYGRFDVTSETTWAPEEPAGAGWYRCDYGGDVYRAAFIFEPTLVSWSEGFGVRLALGPALTYIARNGDTEANDPRREGETVKYGDVVADFYYGCGVDVALTGRYGAALDFRVNHKLGELRAEYPADAAGGFYVTLAPFVRFGGM
jgi:hypothetical protein